MSPSTWLQAQAAALGAAVSTAAVLMSGLAIGLPFLRARIAETFLYSFCCVTAVVLRAVLDLAVRVVALATRSLRPAVPVVTSLKPSGA
jgi:fucose permease